MFEASSHRRPVNPKVEQYLKTEIWSSLNEKLCELRGRLNDEEIFPQQWFVFGSFATNKARLVSDLDIGVVIKDKDQNSRFDKLEIFGESTSYGYAGKHRIELTNYDDLNLIRLIQDIKLLDWDEKEKVFKLGQTLPRITYQELVDNQAKAG